MKASLWQGSRVWPKCDVTRRQRPGNEGSCIVYITEDFAHQHAQNTTFGLFAAASLFLLTGWFPIHFVLLIYDFSFFLSEVWTCMQCWLEICRSPWNRSTSKPSMPRCSMVKWTQCQKTYQRVSEIFTTQTVYHSNMVISRHDLTNLCINDQMGKYLKNICWAIVEL